MKTTLGSFGDVIFETSDDRILTFSNFLRTAAARYADHEVIGVKPVTENIGPGLDNITFTIELRRSLGVDPDEVLNKLMKYNREGHAYPLVIGSKILGVDKWRIGNLGMATNVFGRHASYDSVSVELSIIEYVENQT